jgi:ferredoxin-NADP reductase
VAPRANWKGYLRLACERETNRRACHSASSEGELAHSRRTAKLREELYRILKVDFLSRLHGHIDTKPFLPSPDSKRELFFDGDQAIVADPCILIGRAFALRSMLEMHLQKTFSQGSPKKARIQSRVVNALLATRSFIHGARSMEAVIRKDAESFEVARLPPDDQLQMHVDPINFNHYLDHDVQETLEESQLSSKSPVGQERIWF